MHPNCSLFSLNPSVVSRKVSLEGQSSFLVGPKFNTVNWEDGFLWKIKSLVINRWYFLCWIIDHYRLKAQKFLEEDRRSICGLGPGLPLSFYLHVAVEEDWQGFQQTARRRGWARRHSTFEDDKTKACEVDSLGV